MRFWVARGVDGFRVDVIWQLIKDTLFRAIRPIRISARCCAAY
jgi:glycosidase